MSSLSRHYYYCVFAKEKDDFVCVHFHSPNRKPLSLPKGFCHKSSANECKRATWTMIKKRWKEACKRIVVSKKSQRKKSETTLAAAAPYCTLLTSTLICISFFACFPVFSLSSIISFFLSLLTCSRFASPLCTQTQNPKKRTDPAWSCTSCNLN